jgi:large subunit ribosomal protein L22
MEKQKVKKSVLIRERKEALRDWRDENKGNWGEIKVRLNNVPTSPRKMRLIADMIRGKNAFYALNALKFEAKVGSEYLQNLLKRAIANWKENNESIDLDDVDLYIKEIFVDGGRVLKRLRTAPQGRGYRIRKRSNHITLALAIRDAQ